MAKSIRLRLFHSCRSPTAAAAVTPTTTLIASHHHHPPVVPPSSATCCPRRLRRRHTPPSVAGGSAADADADDLPLARGTPVYRWLKSSRWHVVETAPATDDDTATSPRRKIDARRRRRRRRNRRRLPASGSSDDSGWFISDEESYYYGKRDETETLVTSTTTECSSGSGNSGGTGNGLVVGSFAVVKRSDDPRGDFRRSMAEMVVERGIYDADGLERLLRCFLALNDRRHRRDIVAAFGDVWEAVFSNPTSNGTAGAGEPATFFRY